MTLYPYESWSIFFDTSSRKVMDNAAHIVHPSYSIDAICGRADAGAGLPIKFRNNNAPILCTACIIKVLELDNVTLTSEQFQVLDILAFNEWKIHITRVSARSIELMQELIDMGFLVLLNSILHGTIVAKNYFALYIKESLK